MLMPYAIDIYMSVGQNGDIQHIKLLIRRVQMDKKSHNQNKKKIFKPSLKELKDNSGRTTSMSPVMLNNDPRCTMNGPPPCPPHKCKT